MMTEKDARNLIIDYLYGELEDELKREFEACLELYPALQQEVSELRETREMLQFHMSTSDSSDPGLSESFMALPGSGLHSDKAGFSSGDENENTDGHIYRDVKHIGIGGSGTTMDRVWPWVVRTGLAAAVILIAFLIVGSLSDMQIHSDNNGWTVSFGTEPAVIQQGIDEQTLAEIIELIREENRIMAAGLIEESQIQQEEQIHDLMNTMLEYMDLRREEDLVMLTNGIARVDEQSYQRFQLTSEAVNGLYNTLFTGVQEQN